MLLDAIQKPQLATPYANTIAVEQQPKFPGDLTIDHRLPARSTGRAFSPQGRAFVTMGTDGFGRSDTRAALRQLFGVDAAHIVATAQPRLEAISD